MIHDEMELRGYFIFKSQTANNFFKVINEDIIQ